jgi:beta-barrel assembly-enhancing protease
MKNSRNKLFLAAFVLLSITYFSCKVANNVANGVTSALMPDISEDVKMGKQTDAEIRSKPSEYPLLPENGNEEVYRYVRGITSKILNSGNVTHAKDFPWEVKIINNPKTLNAFCTPGGYIYVYTGLIKYLDTEDQLAGVMGHEIAHADKRHSMRQLYQMYGVQIAAALGAGLATRGRDTSTQKTSATIAQIAASVVGLKFSREHETESDNMSVAYLCGTEYNPAGAAGFFKKIGNANTPPEFLSTHPNPTNRVQNIEAQAAAKTCRGNATNQAQYQRIKSLLK